MKKVLFLISMCLMTLCAHAQEEHLKFMGIELNGTITEFQSKLQAKGITISSKSNQYPVGLRAYEGVFSGEDADILVWYNPRTKQVYRAKAIISRYGKDMIEQLLTKMEGKMDLKYGLEVKSSQKVTDDYRQEFMQYSYSVDNGHIDLFITSTGYSAQNTFYLHLDYQDRENYIKNTQDEMDDL